MTLEEKADVVIGAGNTVFTGFGNTLKLVPGAAGTTGAVERLGIKPTVLADGPAGLRISPTREQDTHTYYCTAYPIGTALACSWNTELVHQIGRSIGNEAKEYGVDVLLAPGQNIQRDPLCGRNFEYFSEDPLVSGKMAAAYVRGVQSNGVGTSIKHFAANNQETNRKDLDAFISQRALREIYLRGFEIAVRESDPWTVMTAYNMINGEQCMESRDLLTTILRDEWGFNGIVMCDWAAPGWRDTAKEIYAGNDLVTPGSPQQKQELIDAVNQGKLSVADLDVCVTRILNYVVRTPRFNGYVFSNKPNLEEHAQTARQAAAESMVLLKNARQTLPLSPSLKKVGLFGIVSYDFLSGGTGSGSVNSAYTVNLLQGLSAANYEVNARVSAFYNGIKKSAAEAKGYTGGNSFMLGRGALAEVMIDPALVEQSAQNDDVAILTFGRVCGEGGDRHVYSDFNLSGIESRVLSTVCKAFHAQGKKVIVILNVSGPVETASWKDQPDAIVLSWMLGQEGGHAVTDLLIGKANPSGKLTMTFPNSYFDTNTYDNFPYDFTGTVFMGNYPKIPKPSRKNVHYVDYQEGVFVGYRYYDTEQKEVSYPFGFGLSYTTFDYSNLKVFASEGGFTVRVDITNTGTVAGKEAAQVYAVPAQGNVPKPAHQLVSFGKTKLLNPGEKQTLSMTFGEKDLAWFDESNSAWTLDGGTYRIQVGASSRDIRQVAPLEISATKVIEKVKPVLALKK